MACTKMAGSGNLIPMRCLRIIKGSFTFLFLNGIILGFLFLNLSVYERLILKSTICQAFFSGLGSTIAGTLVALMIYKYVKPSISKYLMWFVTGFYFLPGVVVTFEIMGVLETFSIPNGMGKIILAHIIMNVSLVATFVLQQLGSILSTHFDVAANLNLNTYQLYKYVLKEPLKRGIGKSFLMVFSFCFVSFMPVILFSNSPLNSTLEVAIYQYFQTTFDVVTALKLILVQITFLLLFFFTYHQPDGLHLMGKAEQCRKELPLSNICTLIGGISFLIILLPALSALSYMITHLFPILQQMWLCMNIFYHTLVLALPVGLATTGISMGMLLFKERSRGNYEKISKYISLLVAVPSVSLTVLFYIFFHPRTLGACLGLIILIQTFIALPLIFKLIAAKFSHIAHAQLEVAQSLRIGWVERLKILYFPQLKKELGIGFIVGFMISMGDFVCVSLLAPASFKTLSVEIFQSITGYQFERAELLTGFIILMYLCLFFPLWKGMKKKCLLF